MTMMGKDGQHVKESSTTASTSSASRHQDEPSTERQAPGALLPQTTTTTSVPAQVYSHQPHLLQPLPTVSEHQQGAPQYTSTTWGHMTTPGPSHQLHTALLSTLPRQQRFIPPPPIPNIVIDPVPARDAFGHSRTPPFVPSPSEWAAGHTSGGLWGLMIPGLGKKPRAHSDSSIMGLEKELEAASPLLEPPASASAVSGRGAPSDKGVFRFESSFIQQQQQLATRSRDTLTVPSIAQTDVRLTPSSTETRASTSDVPMETDRPSISQSPAGTEGLEGALNLSLSPQGTVSSEKPSVPFLWHFHSHKGFEKSPKTYWLRRHSDSNVPGSETEEGPSHSPTYAHQAPASIRSHSTGDTIPTSHMEGHPNTMSPRGLSEGDTPLASPLIVHGPSTSDSPDHSEQRESSPGLSGVRRDEGVVSKRLKLKKYLQKRYLSSLRTGRQRQSSDTDDVFTDRGPETPSPGFLAASQGFTYQPRTPGSGSSRTESSSLEEEDTPTALAPTGEEPEEGPPLKLGTSSQAPHSQTKLVPIKTEPISPCESEGEVEPETPVFAPPQVPPTRGHSESPRWPHSSVFQFHTQGRRSESPVTEPLSEASRREKALPRYHAGSEESTRGGSEHLELRGMEMPAQETMLRRSSEHRLARSHHVESLTSPPDIPQHAGPFSQPPTTSQAPLPPFSTMLQRHPAPHLPATGFPHSPPYIPYTQAGPISPGVRRPWPSPPIPLTQQFPPQLSPTPSTSSSHPQTGPAPHGSKSDPSKIIYCPFSEKVQEQRHSRDPNTTFMCPVCGQVFPSYNYLANHMVNHLPSEVVTKGPGDSNKIHLCKVCNRAFSRSDMLTRHMRLHTGLRPYECRICAQVFSRSDHLHTHLRTHTGEKPYKCPQCPYAAPRRDMITRHMRIHMKQFSRRGRRSSSASSAEPSAGTEVSAGSPSQDVKRRNQSLSSVESQDSTESMFRRSSTASEVPDIDSPQAKSRSWSITSGESMEGPEYPGPSGARHWSATSMESTESYPSPRGEPSPRGRHYFSFHQGSGDSSSGGSGEGAQSLQVPSRLWAMGSSIEESMEHDTSPSPSLQQALSPGSDSLSVEMQTSFQKCKVTSDKESSSGSDKDSNNVSPSRGPPKASSQQEHSTDA